MKRAPLRPPGVISIGEDEDFSHSARHRDFVEPLTAETCPAWNAAKFHGGERRLEAFRDAKNFASQCETNGARS